MNWFILITSLISAGLGTALTLFFGRRKTEAETKEIAVKAEVLLSQEAREFAKQIRGDNQELRKYYDNIIGELKEELHRLDLRCDKMAKENADLELQRNEREKKLNQCYDDMILLKQKMTNYQAVKEEKLETAKSEIVQKVEEKLQEVKDVNGLK